MIAMDNQLVQSLYMYRDTNRRDQAWKEVAEAVGETGLYCAVRELCLSLNCTARNAENCVFYHRHQWQNIMCGSNLHDLQAQ